MFLILFGTIFHIRLPLKQSACVPYLHDYNSLLAQFTMPFHFVIETYRMSLLLAYKTFPLQKGGTESFFQLFT